MDPQGWLKTVIFDGGFSLGLLQGNLGGIIGFGCSHNCGGALYNLSRFEVVLVEECNRVFLKKSDYKVIFFGPFDAIPRALEWISAGRATRIGASFGNYTMGGCSTRSRPAEITPIPKAAAVCILINEERPTNWGRQRRNSRRFRVRF